MHPSAPEWVSTNAMVAWITFIAPLAPIALVHQARTSNTARVLVITGWLMVMGFTAIVVAMTGALDHLEGGKITAGGLSKFLSAGIMSASAFVAGLVLYSPPGR